MATSSVAPWIRYIEKRIPLQRLALLVLGAVLSASQVAAGQYLWLSMIVPFVSVLAFSVLSLAIEDQSNLQAITSRDGTKQILQWGAIATFAIAALNALLYGSLAGIAYATAATYLWIYSKQFFVDAPLSKHPAIAVTLRHLTVPMLALYLVALFAPEQAYSSQGAGYAGVLFGAFFAYSLSRADGSAPTTTATLIAAAMVLAAVSSYYAGVYSFLWPIQGAVIFSSLVLGTILSDRFRNVERVTTIALVTHCWSGAIQSLFLPVGG